ncbi:hypothetical protein [Halobacteriovorax sp. DPLXC-1]|uniref:hypothetical protein n=1 Tax=Halobacteriovorax sp. DPLXC-1 TaxID=3110771 RepID=UPI002FF27DDA
MNNLVITFLLLISALNVAAFSGAEAKFVSKLKKLDGKTGVTSTNTNDTGTGECSIEVDSLADSVSLYFRDTGYYFTPVAHAFSDSAELVDANTLLVSEDSNRPGGDACGSYGGESGYKKTITLNGDSVTIRETFRCFLFKKYDFSFTCKL